MFLPSSLGRANFLDSTPSPAGNEKFIGLFQAFFLNYAEENILKFKVFVHLKEFIFIQEFELSKDDEEQAREINQSLFTKYFPSSFLSPPYSTFNFPDLDFPES